MKSTNKKNKQRPLFKSEKEESNFWDQQDVTEVFDFENAKKVKFKSLKPSTSTISIRLPLELLEDIKILANRRDVPYQSLIKILLREKLDDDAAA